MDIAEERTTEGRGVKVIERRAIGTYTRPVDGYEYFSQIWRSVDGGRTFMYCGRSRDFHTQAEAEAYTLADYDADARQRAAELSALHR